MVINPSSHCLGCGRTLELGEQCLFCLLDLGSSSDESIIEFPSDQVGTQFLSEGVLPKFGDYELIEEIARGGMGIVYRARQCSLNREVAVKLILSGQLATKELVRRFSIEAEAAARLDHPGIVPIYEIGEHDTQRFFSMKLIDGGSLATCFAEYALQSSLVGASSYRRQIGIAILFRSVALAIEYAHEHGVLHRDIKPSNILVDHHGAPYLTDFGLAKMSGYEASGLTLTVAVLGSPHYMAPEQALGNIEDVTTAADVYGLGATFYHLLTGQVPFAGPTALATMKRVVEEVPPRLRMLNPSIHRDLETIVLKCMEKSPAARYRTSSELVQELTRFINGEPILARPVSFFEHSMRWCTRKPLIASLIGSLALTFIVGILGVLWQWQRAETTKLELQTSLDRIRWTDIIEMTNRHEYSEALAVLAKGLRENPSNWRAAMLATSILDHASFAQLRCPPITHGSEFEISSATFNESGQYVATATADRTARIWDTDTGSEIARCTHDGAVQHVSISQQDDTLLTASADGTAGLWRLSGALSTEVEQRALSRIATFTHRGPVNSALFLHNETKVCTASDDGWLRLWQVPTSSSSSGVSSPIGEFEMGQPIVSMAAHSDTHRILLGGRDGTIVEVDVNDPKAPTECWTASVDSPLLHVAFSHDAKYAISKGKRVTCWDLSTNKKVFDGPTQPVLLPAIDSRNSRLHTAKDARTTQIIDLKTGAPVGNSIPTKYLCFASAFSPNGNLLATGGWDYAVKIIDLSTETQAVSPIRGNATPQSLQFGPDSSSLLVVAGSPQFVTNAPSEGASVMIWDLFKPLSQKIYSPFPDRTGWVAISPDGNLIATASLGNARSITLLDRELNLIREVHPPEFSSGPRGLAFTTDGKYLIAGDFQGKVCSICVATGDTQWRPIFLGGEGYAYRMSSNGKLFAKATHAGSLHLMEVETGRILDSVFQHGGQLNDVTFSLDDRLMASASDDHTAKIWDIETGQLLHTLTHDFRVDSCRFSPDGRRLLTGSSDFTARIWDVATGQPIGVTMVHQGEVGSAAISPDGTRILTSARDATARIWDAATGAPLVPLMVHDSALREANFSPDGRLAITVDHDGLQVWDAFTGQPVGIKIRQPSSPGIGHDTCGGRVPFFADGSAAVWGHTTPRMQVIDTQIPPLPVPDWFPTMLELIGGQRIGSTDSPETIELNEIFEARRFWKGKNETGLEYYEKRSSRWFAPLKHEGS